MWAPSDTIFDATVAMGQAAAALEQSSPQLAARLINDRNRVIAELPPVSVKRAAELLGQSRPTIYSWLTRGVLKPAVPRDGGPRRVDAESIASLLPAIREWLEEGGTRRALGVILNRLDSEIDHQLMTVVEHGVAGEKGIPRASPGGFGDIGMTIGELREARRTPTRATGRARRESPASSDRRRGAPKARNTESAARRVRAPDRPATPREHA